MLKYFSAILLSQIFITSVLAQNTGGVFGPIVNENHRSFQYRFTLDPDDTNGDESYAQRLHYEQSFNDDVMWRIVGQWRKTSNSNFDYDFLQAELFRQLTETDTYQSGLRFDIRQRDKNRPDQIGINWMHQYKLSNNWYARALLLTTFQTNNKNTDGVFIQTRANLYKQYAIGDVGIELYNAYGTTQDWLSFEQQSHTIGPFFTRALKQKGWSVFGGALFGLTSSSRDTQLRFWMTKSL